MKTGAVVIVLLSLTGCARLEAKMSCWAEPEIVVKPMVCIRKSMHPRTTCTSDASERAATGALVGHMLGGKHWATAGAIVGASGATQTCVTDTVEECDEYTQAEYAPNPACSEGKK